MPEEAVTQEQNTEQVIEKQPVNENIVPPPTDEDLVGFKPTEPFAPVEEKKPVEQKAEQPVPTTENQEFTPSPVWNYLKERGVEVKEDVLKGNFGEGVTEYDALVQTIIENTEYPGDNDPFISAYMEAEDKNAFIDSYKNLQSIKKLAPDDGLRYIYKNEVDEKGERVFTDEDIEEEIGKMSTLQKKREWNEYQRRIDAHQKEEAGKISEQRKQEMLKNIDKIQEQRTSIANTLLAEEDKITDINGIPYTPEMREQFKKDFIELNKINPETGIPFFNEMLMDNNVLRDVIRAYSLFKDNRIKHHISATKEGNKKEVLEKTDLLPRSKSGVTRKSRGNTDNDYDV